MVQAICNHLFNSFATESDLEAIALKAAMTLPSLMLQKPHAKSKTHDHISSLQRRLSLWEKGDIWNLIKEGRALQKSLARSRPPTRDTAHHASTARRFSKMMMEGRVRGALKLLSDNSDSGLLSLNQVVDEVSGKLSERFLKTNTQIQIQYTKMFSYGIQMTIASTQQFLSHSQQSLFGLPHFIPKVLLDRQDWMPSAGDDYVLSLGKSSTTSVQP